MGDQVFASVQGVPVYCDGSHWVSMAGDVSVTVGGTVNTNNPGGADTNVQYNNGGSAFGGEAAFTYNAATNTLTADNMAGTGAVFTNLTGTLQTAAQGNITSVGTLTGLTMGGNIDMGNHDITNGGTATFTSLAGTLTTAAQPNVTSVGTLSGLTMGGALNLATNNLTNGGAADFTSLSVNGVPIMGSTDTDRIVSGTAFVKALENQGGEVIGTFTLTSTGSETCDAAHHYALRVNPSTGMLQMCRP